jgi:hypothetical protein
MTPSTKEITAGQKACERIAKFQRYSSPFDLIFTLLLLGGVSLWNAFERGGWNAAGITLMLWFTITAVSVYQYQRLKKQAQEASTLLKTLKTEYGEDVYSEIQKGPHSLYYYLVLKRYPPFNRQSVKLP